MSGGGGDNGVLGILPAAAALAATVMTDGAAAPMLGEALGAEAGVGATMLGSGVIGAGVGGTSALLTGQDPLRGALYGGATGAAMSGIGGMMDNSFASGLSSDAAAGIGPGASTTQIGGQEFNQNLYDASSQAEDSAGYPGANNQVPNPNFTPPPGSNPIPTPSGLAATQPFDAAGYSGANNQVPGTQNGYQQIGSNTPQANTQAPTQLSDSNPQSPNYKAPPVAPSVDKGLFGSGISGKQAMVGLGGLALWNAIQKENSKYGVPTTQSSVPSNLNYTLAQHAPMQLSRTYAAGGSVDLNTSPIKQQLNGMATGDNQMFPQPGLHSNQYANPASTPVPGNVLSAPTDTLVDPYTGQQRMAAGGIANASSLGSYAAGGNPRLLKGPGDGMSDNIPATIADKQPARLADGEFVVPADVVSHLGNGSTDAGAQRLHSMMDKVRMARTGKKAQGKQIKADKYMPSFAEGGSVPAINAQLPNQQVTPAASPALVLPSQTPAAAQGLGATAPAQAAQPAAAQAPTSMTDQMAAYRSNMMNQYAPTDANFIKQQYLSTLGRAPDASGADYWTQQMKNGMSPQDVASGIANSPEAQHVSGIRTAMNNSNAGGPQAQAANSISSLYHDILGRAPDTAGFQFWQQALQNGQPISQIKQAFLTSPEYLAKQSGAGGSSGLNFVANSGGTPAATQQDQFNQLMAQYQAQQSANATSDGGAGGG